MIYGNVDHDGQCSSSILGETGGTECSVVVFHKRFLVVLP